ncbi:hypothetical protein Tco_0360778 [Tanacetum coccineum]
MALRELSELTLFSLDGLRKWSLCLALAIARQLVKSNLQLALYKTMLLHGGMPCYGPLTPRNSISCYAMGMFPEEIDKIEKYIGGLPDMIHGSVKASKPKTMQEAIEFTTELMDDKTQAYAERQAERKRKYDDLSKNNQNQQNNRQNAGQAYKAGTSDRKSYVGISSMFQVLIAIMKQGNGALSAELRHFKRNCPRLRNNDRGNQAGNDRALAKCYVVGKMLMGKTTTSFAGCSSNNRYVISYWIGCRSKVLCLLHLAPKLTFTPSTLGSLLCFELADG